MGKDLFECDLATVTLADFEAFVDLRLDEGLRLDYKDQLPQKLGDAVTAFSNSLGGLLFLGVRRTNRTPTEVTGIERKPNSDLKTQLASKIASTIYPRPEFSIAVIPHATKPNFDVAVIRVEAGTESPYMFLTDRKVSVRVEDQNLSASLTDLEDLFRRRNAAPNEAFDHEDRDIFVVETRGDAIPQRAETYYKCWVSPSRPLPLRIDRRVEAEFRSAVSAIFPGFHDIEIADRHGLWVDVAYAATNVKDLQARWRLTSNGSLGFVIQPYHSGRDAVMLADLVYDAARFIRGSAALLQRLGWEGAINVQAVLVTMARTILPGNGDQTAKLDGVVHIGKRSNRGPLDWYETFASPRSVVASEFIAEHLIDTLRTERTADIDYEQLLASVRRLAGEQP